ncbi:large ribosomal subunit protein uL23m isoform X3 [Crocuta crocuta]
MEMTRVDLRNYLERIYNVPVAAVRTRVQHGSNRKRDYRNVRMKKPDYKVAYVQLIRMPLCVPLCPSGSRRRCPGAPPRVPPRAPSRAPHLWSCSGVFSKLKRHLTVAQVPGEWAGRLPRHQRGPAGAPCTRAWGSGLGLGRHWHILNF